MDDLTQQDTRELLYRQLRLAYGWLFKTGMYKGHWNEVRSTALVALCLDMVEPAGSRWLESCRNWLLARATEISPSEMTWGEELWDTSLALLALDRLGLPRTDPRRQKAIAWMRNLYDLNGSSSWHEEPWETCFTPGLSPFLTGTWKS
jgi:hypothetical protein